MKRLYVIMICILAVAMFTSGCSLGMPGAGAEKSAGTLKQLGKNETASIKVLYYDKNMFFQQFGNLFMAKYPNIDVDVISTQGIYGPNTDYKVEFAKLIETEKPDVLLFPSMDMYEQWAMDGKLFAIDDVIKQDKFDVENILPAVTEYIKAKGNGKLYGLSPNFSSQALFYNKDLFEKHGVPLPKDQMSWAELIQLAKRFPTDGQGDARIYGYAANYSMNGGKDVGYYYWNAIGGTQGLSFVDPNSMKVSMKSEGWKNALQLTVDALKSGAFYTAQNSSNPMMMQTMQDYLKRNLFVSGRVAMTMDGSYLIETLRQAKETLKDVNPVNWDMVTVPVDPQNPNVAGSVSVNSLFAIRGDTDNRRAAWEFIKYVNSEEMARITSKSTTGGLMSRVAYLKDKDGHNMEAFYKLKPNENSLYKGAEKIPAGFYTPFSQLAAQTVQDVVDGKQTADDALNQLQEKGQEILIKARQEQEAKDSAEKAGTAEKP
ncbi:ABC transporter substrate-binding protein [Paenibacillus allorhizosphaerae]|uniref:Extracellular solute-binding protein n=1 Tax=Paenibacillus allorhizosphaerae TaxID=2849866 RepID=A0ABM8VPM3_9BACL|nr:extracellular solute-binding protein [Paenibacillus allorhizosphaerae]CAG7653105.1 hypothetical protein PAECIP111802_05398 [Paenibacillus allorhizosphaerae]